MKTEPTRQAPADAIKRVAPRLSLVAGDVVVRRELLPRVNPNAIAKGPQWRYRVCVEGQTDSVQLFDGFASASASADELAARRHTRIMFVEDGVVALVADYRPSSRR